MSRSDVANDDDDGKLTVSSSSEAESDKRLGLQSSDNLLKQDFTISSASSLSEDDDVAAADKAEKQLQQLQNADTEVVALSTSPSSDKMLDILNDDQNDSQKRHSSQDSSDASEDSSDSLELNESDEEQITQQLINGLESELKLETDADGNKTYSFDIESDSDGKDGDRLAAEDEVLEQVRKILMRRDGKQNKARRRWLDYERKQKEAEEQAKQFEAYWKRRHEEDRDLWRDKDFANAVDKMSRAGYVGVHGNYTVPASEIRIFNALYMQITVGDYDGNDCLECADEWKKLKGKGRIECQREFIRRANQTITKYGWNPPPGWK